MVCNEFLPALAFDHNVICADAVFFAKKLIEEDPFAFLPAEFTLTELQNVFAAFGGNKFTQNKRNFRFVGQCS